MKLMPLLLMGMLATALSGCESDNEPDLKVNYDTKMTAVTQEVRAKKSTDKALLLVSFGSTWDAPQQSFKEMIKSFKAKFPDRDVYFSFTSEICMTRCAQKGWKYYAPKFYLEALGSAGYKDIAVVYSGDAAVVLDENEDMSFYMPSQGTNIWCDAMVIPQNAENPKLAHEFINYMLTYEAAFDNTETVGYTSPNAEVFEEMTSSEDLYADNAAYLPRSGYDKDEMFHDNQTLMRELSKLWIKVKAAK